MTRHEHRSEDQNSHASKPKHQFVALIRIAAPKRVSHDSAFQIVEPRTCCQLVRDPAVNRGVMGERENLPTNWRCDQDSADDNRGGDAAEEKR
jgi:hypothetical protein